MPVLFWLGILLFSSRLGSCRQIRFKFNTPQFLSNLSLISKEIVRQLPHSDTLSYLIKRISPVLVMPNFPETICAFANKIGKFRLTSTEYKRNGIKLIRSGDAGLPMEFIMALRLLEIDNYYLNKELSGEAIDIYRCPCHISGKEDACGQGKIDIASAPFSIGRELE